MPPRQLCISRNPFLTEAGFNYCPLVWNFSSFKSLKKVEDIQKRALRFLNDDNESSYEELLIQTGKNSMNVNRLKSLCIEMFKTINDMNPYYLKEIFELAVKQRPVRQQHIYNLKTISVRTTTF